MSNGSAPPSPEQVGEFWDRQARALTESTRDAALPEFATLTREREVLSLRDRLECAHLERVLRLTRDSRVLDLGGGAGRFALRLAPRVREVTLVDLSGELLAVAEREARRLGLSNLRTQRASACEFRSEERYDTILIMNVCCYFDDSELERLAGHLRRWLAPGGRLIVKEPVTTDGQGRVDERNENGVHYRALFRPREFYAEVIGRQLRCVYQQATCAHFFPWFVGGTEGAVQASSSPLGRRALQAISPLLVRADPALRRLEDAVRGSALLSPLLADVPVLQDLYVFEHGEEHGHGHGKEQGHEERGPELSVVVIAYNEVLCLLPVVRELSATLARAGVDAELVLVDDGSSDATLEHMRVLERELPRVRVVALSPNRGIGGALRAGFDAARGRHVTWIPADGQIAPESVLALFRRRAEAPMVTTVYRTRADAWYRHAISTSLNTLIALQTGQPAKSGGNYIFQRTLWNRHAPRGDDTMMLSTAFRHNLKAAGERIQELEIDARPRVAGESKVLNPKTITRTLARLLRM